MRDGGRWNLARVPGERRHFLPCQEEALPCAGPEDSTDLRTGFYKASLAFLKDINAFFSSPVDARCLSSHEGLQRIVAMTGILHLLVISVLENAGC